MPYHHGNARAALLDAADAMLEESGAGPLSLRQCAERAGLSRQAPYNHFDDKSALLAELASRGFQRLAGSMRAARTHGVAPVEALAFAAQAYILFGRASPALFRLMFSSEQVDRSRHPRAAEAAAAAFSDLGTLVSALRPGRPDQDVEPLRLVAWSLVHGYTTLCLEAGIDRDGDVAERAGLFARTVEALAQVR